MSDNQPVSLRRRRTRDRLIDAARGVIAARGVAGASIEEICERAGFTRGAFYSNFVDKEELVAAMHQRELTRVLAALSDATVTPAAGSRATGAGDGLDGLVEAFFTLQPLETDHYLISSELQLRAVREGTPDSPAAQETQRFQEVVTRALEEALARAGRVCAIEPRDVVDILTGVLQQSHLSALLVGDPDLHRLARTAMPRIIDALTRPIAQ